MVFKHFHVNSAKGFKYATEYKGDKYITVDSFIKSTETVVVDTTEHQLIIKGCDTNCGIEIPLIITGNGSTTITSCVIYNTCWLFEKTENILIEKCQFFLTTVYLQNVKKIALCKNLFLHCPLFLECAYKIYIEHNTITMNSVINIRGTGDDDYGCRSCVNIASNIFSGDSYILLVSYVPVMKTNQVCIEGNLFVFPGQQKSVLIAKGTLLKLYIANNYRMCDKKVEPLQTDKDFEFFGSDLPHEQNKLKYRLAVYNPEAREKKLYEICHSSMESLFNKLKRLSI